MPACCLSERSSEMWVGDTGWFLSRLYENKHHKHVSLFLVMNEWVNETLFISSGWKKRDKMQQQRNKEAVFD